MDSVKALWTRFQRTPAWRAWSRYGDARGNLLAGGVTYFAFFSIFPAVALAFTVFGLFLQGHPDWLDQIKDYLNQTLPGFVKEGDKGLIPLEAPSGSALTVTGLVGLAGLLWAGLGWLGALRDGIRAVFGASGEPGNFVVNKLRDLGVLVILGLGIVISAAVTGVAGATTSWIAEQIGLGGQGWILKIVTVVVGVFLDGAIVLVILRLLSGVDVPWKGLRSGALVGGIGLTVLKLLGTSLLGAANNPLFASIALVVGLLVWLNFMSRIVLLSSAWAANDLDDALGPEVTKGAQDKLMEGPHLQAGSLSAAGTSAATASATAASVGSPSVVSTRGADRVTLAAGAVLGAAVAAGVGSVAKVLHVFRRR